MRISVAFHCIKCQFSTFCIASPADVLYIVFVSHDYYSLNIRFTNSCGSWDRSGHTGNRSVLLFRISTQPVRCTRFFFSTGKSNPSRRRVYIITYNVTIIYISVSIKNRGRRRVLPCFAPVIHRHPVWRPLAAYGPFLHPDPGVDY